MEQVDLLRTGALAVHASAAVLAWVAGLVVLRTGAGLAAHGVGVVLMTAALVPSMTLGWDSFPVLAKVMFSGLAVLAVVMVGQVVRAGRIRQREESIGQVWTVRGRPIGPDFVRVVGFNVISLSVAGLIVPVLRVGGGALGVIAVVVAIVPVAHLLVERRRSAVLNQLRLATAKA